MLHPRYGPPERLGTYLVILVKATAFLQMKTL